MNQDDSAENTQKLDMSILQDSYYEIDLKSKTYV